MGNRKNIDINTVVNLLESGKTLVEIAEIVGCSVSNIGKRLQRKGISFKRDYTKTRYKRTNRYSLDEHFFDFIDTEEKAYFLGLLYSDGSVSSNQFYLKMTDLDIIERLQRCLKTEIPIRTITPSKESWKQSYILQVSSKYLCNKLSKWGCIPNKARFIRLPKINPPLISHFIRGFFDGDGCLQLNDKIYHCRLDIVSASKEFLEDLRPIIAEHGKTIGYLGKEKKYDVWHLNFSGHQVLSILEWLYKDATVYMQRKYNKYKLLSSL